MLAFNCLLEIGITSLKFTNEISSRHTNNHSAARRLGTTVLTNDNHGSRKDHSCETQLITMIGEIYRNLEKLANRCSHTTFLQSI